MCLITHLPHLVVLTWYHVFKQHKTKVDIQVHNSMLRGHEVMIMCEHFSVCSGNVPAFMIIC